MENGMHDTQIKFLRNISFFSDLNRGVLDRIAEAMEVKEFKDGERIIKQGEVRIMNKERVKRRR
jgi:signal-transduction protein with cAMP-binding, CBS, and nucleotidyltransferase domain